MVNEAVNDGSDRRSHLVNYVLAAGTEIELLATTDAGGTTAINLTGNAFSQTILGNAGANMPQRRRRRRHHDRRRRQ